MTNIFPQLAAYMEKAQAEAIPQARKELLQILARQVVSLSANGDTVQLVFICTHNSRRSHMAQLWAAAAAHKHGMPANVRTYSGGTEATAFFPKAVQAMVHAGWSSERLTAHPAMEQISLANPGYLMRYSEDAPEQLCFSKHFGEPPNPKSKFIAVMTCSDADENCPFVPGASARFSIPYEDPKAFDLQQDAQDKYDERCLQIAAEMLYTFSHVAQTKGNE